MTEVRGRDSHARMCVRFATEAHPHQQHAKLASAYIESLRRLDLNSQGVYSKKATNKIEQGIHK
jgi:hypothetical protein